ncbi:UxaA family hydrolase [Paenibacillus sp. sptzw28]|uniref:UxaA family hydrolase n=1 Tax=Paenibacillus sp. sptzw28 TaxID=715179 RepID=UPI001C6E98FA|nr:UxaA family hydrolase [Paenibacillus sp. sptzw28]QYR23313.1 UxaA family hydrolase [Paenibacillus sp. sptzw28]
MAGLIQTGADALVVDVKDDVATALRDIKSGETIMYRSGENVQQVEALDNIQFGHKIAIKPIAAGSQVRKYGEVIGQATEEIAVGRHVHVHNVEGIRGRGDQAGGETK